jgi:actin-related protein
MAEAAIFECGSGFSKVGYSRDKAPRAVFPTVVGRPRGSRAKAGAVGEAALARDQKAVELMRPVQHGVTTDWETMENIWEYIMLNHMSTPIEETPLLITETPLNSKKNREKLAEVMFETYKPPSLYLALKPVLSLYAHGETSGCVLQSGDDVTHALCVKDGYAISGTVVKSHAGGRAGTEHMRREMAARGPDPGGMPSDQKVRELKERNGRVSLHFDAEPLGTTSYALPDGQRFEIGKERFACAEANFNPSCIGGAGVGFVDCITESINMCHETGMKKIMYESIVIAGGNTMYRNTDVRLRSSVNELLSGKSFTAKIAATGNRKHYAWIGGSVISSLSTFQDMMITEADYKENGANIVHLKCPFYASAAK